MIFSSYAFIFLFLPVVLTGYFLLSKTNRFIQHSFLFLASLFFYAYFSVSYLLIIVISIIVNYSLAKALAGNKTFSKPILTAGVLFNVGMLGYFKYYNFFIDNINSLFSTNLLFRSILLPLGISFFTFQQLLFLKSAYKGEAEAGDFLSYCLFVSFFPKLAAGPIVLHSEMIPQFTEDKNRFVNSENIAKGLYMFSIGLFKKIVIADTVVVFVNNGFDIENIGLAAAWITTLLYSLQIYFDFSGYSDMAIGLGKMFNIDIPQNFISPYKAESVTEFWRKWHITLGRALSALVYFPLGGSRKGKARTYINLFIVFLVSGFWHGAAWTFIIWGALHGLCCIFERLFKKPLSNIPKAVRIAGTFITVHLLRVLFRSPGIPIAIRMYKSMFSFSNISISQLSVLVQDGWVSFPGILNIIYILSLTVVLYAVVFRAKNSTCKFEAFSPQLKNMIFTALILCISIIHLSRESIFIYFNF